MTPDYTNNIVLSQASDDRCVFVYLFYANVEVFVLELGRDVCHINWPPMCLRQNQEYPLRIMTPHRNTSIYDMSSTALPIFRRYTHESISIATVRNTSRLTIYFISLDISPSRKPLLHIPTNIVWNIVNGTGIEIRPVFQYLEKGYWGKFPHPCPQH